MANDNAEGAYTFDPLAGKPPAHHEVWNVSQGVADPGIDGNLASHSDVNFAAIRGVPCPDDHGTDTYTGIPGDGVVGY